jgi:hypothetical protein
MYELCKMNLFSCNLGIMINVVWNCKMYRMFVIGMICMILNFPGGTEKNRLKVCVRFVGFGGESSAWQQSLTIFIDGFLGLLTDTPEKQDFVLNQAVILYCRYSATEASKWSRTEFCNPCSCWWSAWTQRREVCVCVCLCMYLYCTLSIQL